MKLWKNLKRSIVSKLNPEQMKPKQHPSYKTELGVLSNSVINEILTSTKPTFFRKLVEDDSWKRNTHFGISNNGKFTLICAPDGSPPMSCDFVIPTDTPEAKELVEVIRTTLQAYDI